MKHVVVIAAVLQAFLGTAVLACDGQTGNVIFSDTFADDSGGWDMTVANVKIVPPAMVMTLDKSTTGIIEQNLTFNAGDGDYCMQFAFPPPVDKNVLGAGLVFWGTDYNNFYIFQVLDDQTAAFYKKVGGTWIPVFTGVKLDGFNTAPGTVHTILVQAKAQTLTFSVDGKKVKTIRAQMPAGPLRFGPQVQSNAVLTDPTPSATFKISGFSVTAGQ